MTLKGIQPSSTGHERLSEPLQVATVPTLANQLPSGDRRAVESEIFWKARGDYLQFAVALIACVFKKLSEAIARR
jgi:hypothetical protein